MYGFIGTTEQTHLTGNYIDNLMERETKCYIY